MALAIGAIATSGCGPADDRDVRPNVVLLARAGSGLSAAAPTALNGTYTGCTERSGAWSLRISGTDPLANDPLSVVMNDTGCQLTITELVADTTYTTSSPIALSTAYGGSASPFAPASGGAVALAVNAKADALTFASDFAITVVYSDATSATDVGDAIATYATVEASSSSLLVPAPDYTISLTETGAALTLQLDVAKIVQSVSGVASLTDHSVTGEEYVVDLGTLGASPTYASVALAYAAATKHTISGANPQVPASQLGLVGQSLGSPVVRTIIVSHTVALVKSYELFKITFRAP